MAVDAQGRATGLDRIAAAFASHGKSAALMPYLMGGFPDVEASVRIGEAYADGGADLVEVGVAEHADGRRLEHAHAAGSPVTGAA